jgi:uncharacterized OB-fold protein
VTDDRPLPGMLSESDRTFWAAAADERLLIQACSDCGEPQFFPRAWCHYCGSPDVEWLEAAGTGHVHTFTIIRRATELGWFADRIPYVVAYVELEEGVRLCTNVVGCEPESVELGMHVTVTFEHVTDRIAIPQFEPR